MDEKRMQQIINDKRALEELRARGFETRPDDHRSPSQILIEVSQRVIEQTVQITDETL